MKKLFLLILLPLLLSCREDNSSLFDPTYWGNGFKGITFVDETGTILKTDNTDWCYAFGVNNSCNDSDVVECNTFRVGYELFPAYPNPVISGESFNLRFSLPKSSFVKVIMVNSDYDVVKIITNENLSAGHYRITVNTDDIFPNIYRIIFEAETFYCSGDVWIKEH